MFFPHDDWILIVNIALKCLYFPPKWQHRPWSKNLFTAAEYQNLAKDAFISKVWFRSAGRLAVFTFD